MELGMIVGMTPNRTMGLLYGPRRNSAIGLQPMVVPDRPDQVDLLQKVAGIIYMSRTHAHGRTER
jgi:hypothetical protein